MTGSQLPNAYGDRTTTPIHWLIVGHNPGDELHTSIVSELLSYEDQVWIANSDDHHVLDLNDPTQITSIVQSFNLTGLLFHPSIHHGNDNSDDHLVLFRLSKALINHHHNKHNLDQDDDHHHELRIITTVTTAATHGIPTDPRISATQFAIEGLMETIALEIQPFGGRSVLVDIGPNVGAHTTRPEQTVRFARLIAQLSHCSAPPIRASAGEQAANLLKTKLRWIAEEIEDWKFLYEQ